MALHESNVLPELPSCGSQVAACCWLCANCFVRDVLFFAYSRSSICRLDQPVSGLKIDHSIAVKGTRIDARM